jgi:hypothetical protein
MSGSNNFNNSTKKTKQVLITQNLTGCKFGFYTNCEVSKALKTSFISNFNLGEIMNICEVSVINAHPIDISAEMCNKGINAKINSDSNPVLMCVVNRNDFYGTNFVQSEGITDDIYNIRTNFNMIVSQGNPFPLKDKECVYSKYLTVIRDENLTPLNPSQTYRFGLIVISPIYKPTLLNESQMKSTDFLNTMANIETLFQSAIYYGHNILLCTPFGHLTDEIPQEDIIIIYNAMILKYQHYFNKIIFCISPWDGEQLFKLFNKKIIRPQNLQDSIYANSSATASIKSDSPSATKSDSTSDTSSTRTDEKIQMKIKNNKPNNNKKSNKI